MRGNTRFSIIGLVGAVFVQDDVTDVEIGSWDPSDENVENGDWITQADWNTVAVCDETISAWISENLDTGDLVYVKGQLKDGSYHVGDGGVPVTKSDLVVVTLNRLARVDQIDTPFHGSIGTKGEG